MASFACGRCAALEAEVASLQERCRDLELENDMLALRVSKAAAPPTMTVVAPASSPMEEDFASVIVHGEAMRTLRHPRLHVAPACDMKNCLSVALRPGCADSFAVGGADGVIRLYEGDRLLSSTRCASPPIALGWEPTIGGRLAAGCMDGSTLIVDIVDSQLQQTETFKHHTKFVVALCWSSRGGMLVTCARDASINLYVATAPGGAQLAKRHTFVFPANPESCTFVGDGTLLVFVRGEPFLRYIDLATVQEQRVSLNEQVWDTHSSFNVLRLAHSAEKNLVVAATDKHKHVVYALRENKQVRILTGHSSDEYSNTRALWMDSVIVSNSKDNAIYHWDFASGSQLHTVVRAHDSQIRDMDCLGSTVATASFDKTVKLWSPHLPPAERPC